MHLFALLSHRDGRRRSALITDFLEQQKIRIDQNGGGHNLIEVIGVLFLFELNVGTVIEIDLDRIGDFELAHIARHGRNHRGQRSRLARIRRPAKH